MVQCEEKKNTSPQMQQQLKAGDKNEFKPFFFSILWYKRNQNIYSIEELYSAQWGRPCKFLYTLEKRIFIFYLKGSPY